MANEVLPKQTFYPKRDMIKDSNKWYQVTINKLGIIDGDVIFKLLSTISTMQKLQYAIIEDIDRMIKMEYIGLSKFEYEEGQIILLQDYLKCTHEIAQYVWADFFLFENLPVDWKNDGNQKYPELIKQTDMTLRIIDNTYIGIHTQNEEIVDFLKNEYQIMEFHFDDLENLNYPY